MHLNEENDDKISEPPEGIRIPDGLEDSIVDALKKERLIKRSGIRALPVLKAAAGIIAIAGAFALGWLVRGDDLETHDNTKILTQSRQYLLLTRDPGSFIANENQNAEYGQWVQENNEHQNILSGAELEEKGWALKGTDVFTYSSPDYSSNNQGSISGFFIISAMSDTQAIRIASKCPHLDYNGVLELRPMN